MIQLDTKARIDAAAQALFVREGIANVSMRKIAKEVGITATAIYRHYPDKAALVATLVRDAFQQFGYFLMRHTGRARSPQERMDALGQGYMEFVWQHPEKYRLKFMTPWEDELQSLTEETQADGWATFQLLEDRIRECQQAGIFISELPAEIIAHAIWSTCHGQATIFLLMEEDMPQEVFFLRFSIAVRATSRGFAVHPEQHPFPPIVGDIGPNKGKIC